MDRKFICDECSNIYSSRQSRWRHKKNDHAKSVPYRSYTLQRPTVKGGNLETLEKILQSPDEEPLEEEKHRTKEDIEKILQKVLQSLDEKSQDDEKSEDNEKGKTIQDIENEIFEKVTLEERKRFYRVLDELRLRKSRLESEDFEKIDRILPQYFEKEYEYGMEKGIRIKKESFSAQIREELRALQCELPLLSLEMQMILTFMDEKRWAIQNLLSIMESSEKDSEKDKSLLRKELHGVISEEEYQELKKDLSMDSITRVLLKRKFKPMYSEICNM